MTIDEIIARYEKEKGDIHARIEALKERDGILDILLAELKSSARTTTRSAPRKKAPKATAKKRKARGSRKGKGGTTVRDAILAVVRSEGKPVTAGEIVKKAAEVSGGAEASIRTQINTLTRLKEIEQVPYAGRGFLYQMAGAKKAPAPAAPKKKAAAKPAKKTRAKAKPKAPAAKK